MQIFQKRKNRNKISILKEIPENIIFFPNKPAIIKLKNGKNISLSCLNCKNPLCINYSNEEIEFTKVPNISYDKNSQVCPTNAINFDEEKQYPIIEYNKCINCGLCVKRCPAGALYYDNNKIKINLENSVNQEIVEATKVNEQIQEQQLNKLKSIKKEGTFIVESHNILREIYKKIFDLKYDIHNLFIRNILLELKCKCAIRRIGDVYTRMDGIYCSKDSIGAIEIEFGKDTLDASRGILDDIAVLHARYKISKNINNPLVVCLQLPNIRQGYWQVVKDINTVENIKINTITVGALLILLWNNKELDLKENSFYVDFDNMNITAIVEKILTRDLKIKDDIFGIFEPVK